MSRYWRDQAACFGLDTEIWYRVANRAVDAVVASAQAKAIWATCPVTVQCADAADSWGTWAGQTERERHNLVRRGERARAKERAAAGTSQHGTEAREATHRRAGEVPCQSCTVAATRAKAARIDPLDRLTHTGVLARLEAQTGGVVSWRDLTALPCSHPHCSSVGYLMWDDSGAWKSLTALIGHDTLKRWLELAPDSIANRVSDQSLPAELRSVVKDSLLGLLSEQSSLSHPRVGDLWKDICENCDLGVATLATLAAGTMPGQRRRLRRLLGERVTRITVKPFMDMSTMIEERRTQCCVQVGTRSEQDADQCAPFCAVQAWPRLARQRISMSTTRSESLPEGLTFVQS